MPNDEKVVGGDYSCVSDKCIDRRPRQDNEDGGTKELKLIMKRHSLEDIWRLKNPKTIRYTFHRHRMNDHL